MTDLSNYTRTHLFISSLIPKIDFESRIYSLHIVKNWIEAEIQKNPSFLNMISDDEMIALEELYQIPSFARRNGPVVLIPLSNATDYVYHEHSVYKIIFKGIFFNICEQKPVIDCSKLILFTMDYLMRNKLKRYTLSRLWVILSKKFPIENTFIDNNIDIARKIESIIIPHSRPVVINGHECCICVKDSDEFVARKSDYSFPNTGDTVDIDDYDVECNTSNIWTFFYTVNKN